MGDLKTHMKDLPFFRDLEQERILKIDLCCHPKGRSLAAFLNGAAVRDGITGFLFRNSGSGGIESCWEKLENWAENKPDNLYFGLYAQLKARPGKDDLDIITQGAGVGLKLMAWNCPRRLKRFDTQFLWDVSKRKIWNHLHGECLIDGNLDFNMKRFIFDNSNIVHSYGSNGMNGEDQGDLDRYGAYSKTAGLPGQPVWKILGDPATILKGVSLLSSRTLAGLRWETGSGLIRLGSEIVYYYQSPKDLPQGFMDEICRMVDAGGSVDITHVRANLERAYLIGYAMENDVIVGNSSLKHPRREFIGRLRKLTGLDFTGFVERGYTSVRPEYRASGVGKTLLEGLTRRAGDHKVFSIIDEKNLAVQKIARRNNTRKVLTYFSDKLQKNMGIWMPDHMIGELKDSLEMAGNGRV